MYNKGKKPTLVAPQFDSETPPLINGKAYEERVLIHEDVMFISESVPQEKKAELINVLKKAEEIRVSEENAVVTPVEEEKTNKKSKK